MNNQNIAYESGDNIYYNIVIPHDDNLSKNGSPTRADYFEMRSTPLLTNPAKDYVLSVVRMSIPTSEIPIQIIPVDISQPDVNQTLYTFTLTWDGNEFKQPVFWNPSNLYVTPPPDISVAQDPQYAPYYYLYSIKHFTVQLNNALQSIYNSLILAGAPITAPAFFDYDPDTNRMSLVVPLDYVTNNVLIYSNVPLARNFGHSFDQRFYGYSDDVVTTGKAVLWVVDDDAVNYDVIEQPPWPSQTYVRVTQDYNTVSDMTSFESLVLTTRSIPVRHEWISLQSIKGAVPLGTQLINTPSNNSTQNGFLNLLTDFEVDITTGGELRSKVIYNPTGEYRRVTLRGSSKINTIDIQVFWKDNYDNLYPLQIPAHDELTIKILFEKK